MLFLLWQDLHCTITLIDEDKIEELKSFLPTPELLKGLTMYPEEFEKVFCFML